MMELNAANKQQPQIAESHLDIGVEVNAIVNETSKKSS